MRTRKRRITIVLIVFAALFLSGGVFWNYWRYREPYLAAASRLEATKAEAQELGLALTANDLHPGNGLDPKDNAAEEYRRAALLISASGVRAQGGAGAPIGTFVFSGGDPAYRPNAELAVKLTEVPAEVLDEAFKKPYCDFHIDYQGGVRLDTLAIVDIRPMAYVYGARAVFAAQQHKVDEALENVYKTNRLREQLTEDPAFARVMLSGLAEPAGPITLAVVLSLLGESPEVVQKVRALLKRMPVTYSMEFALKSDLLSGLLDVDSLGNETDTYATRDRRRREREALIKDFVPESLLKDAYKERLIRFWINLEKSIQNHKGDPFVQARQIDNLVAGIGHEAGPSDDYVRTAMPIGYWNVASGIMRHRGYLAIIEGYLDIMDFKLKNGSLPASASDLKLPEDPFTKRPLLYTRTAHGYLLSCDVAGVYTSGTPMSPLGIQYPGPVLISRLISSNTNSRTN